MQWAEICDNPKFHDMPFRIETDEMGKIIMSPVKLLHFDYQCEITRLLSVLLPHGRSGPECAVKTEKGTKVPDVVWISMERRKQNQGLDEAVIAPEICVEVWSDSNTEAEMTEKTALYIAAGAAEVWICRDGNMTFFNAGGRMERSKMAPEFPTFIEV